MKILIIEDEPQAAHRLISLLKLLKPDVELLASLDSIKQSVAWLNLNPTPDLIKNFKT